MKFISILAASAAFVMLGTSAFADELKLTIPVKFGAGVVQVVPFQTYTYGKNQVTFNLDGSYQVVVRTEANAGFFNSGKLQLSTMFCSANAGCSAPVVRTVDSDSVTSSLVSPLIRAGGFVGAMMALRPPQTNIENGSGSYSSNYAPQSVTSTSNSGASSGSCSGSFCSVDAPNSPSSFGSSGVDSNNYTNYGSLPDGGKG